MSFALNIISIFLGFIISVLLARILGARGYGSYSYALAWVNLLVVPAAFGLDKLVIRVMASSLARKEWGRINGIVRWSIKRVLLSSMVILVGYVSVSWLVLSRNNSDLMYSLWLAVILLPLMTLTLLRQASMQGLHAIVKSQIPNRVIRPIIFTVMLLAWYFASYRAGHNVALLLNILAVLIAFIVGTYWLIREMPIEAKQASPSYDSSAWIRSAIPLMFFGGVQVINAQTATILLGVLATSKAVGIYTVVTKVAELIVFPLFAVNSVFAPIIAKSYAEKKVAYLQKIATETSRILLISSVIIALLLAFFSMPLLGIFGKEFVGGDTALYILCLGAVVNSGMGSVGLLLVMTGRELDAAIATVGSLFTNVVLCILLIPSYGINGAAVAASFSMVLLNMLMAYRVYRTIGIVPGAFYLRLDR